jgi:hypothetical protein
VECSFGSTITYFRLLGKAIQTSIKNAVQVVKATTLLDNVTGDLEGFKELDVHTKRAVSADLRMYVTTQRSCISDFDPTFPAYTILLQYCTVYTSVPIFFIVM